ncbi:MAG: hypothetical protein ACFFEF_15015 [Candidatus Thorarchaeota archaeon]
MNDLEILRTAFVAFLDGLWWGLRDNVGPLSMYEGYEGGFRQLGIELADQIGGSGPEEAAGIASEIMNAMGLETEARGTEVFVRKCPIWNRIKERGLEFAFHVEEICWKPMLEGIGEKTATTPKVITSLRLNHIAMSKITYKKSKAKTAFENGNLSQDEFDKEMAKLSSEESKIPQAGQYKFE